MLVLHAAEAFREPAVPGIVPRLFQWTVPEDSLLAHLKECFGPTAQCTVACMPPGSAVTYCHVAFADSGERWFGKVLPAPLATAHQASLPMADFLATQGVHVPINVPGYPKPFGDGRTAFAYRFIDAQYVSMAPGTPARLGRSLAGLHTALAAYPGAASIARQGESVRHALRRQAIEMLDDTGWPAAPGLHPVRTDLQTWLEADARLGGHEFQVIHNDLNAANILQDARGRLWFLDFEEAAWSYLPPIFDLAKLIERFVLVQSGWDISRRAAAVRALVEAYRTLRPLPDGLAQIGTALRWSQGLAWLRLAPVLARHDAEQHAEVQKFLGLARVHTAQLAWLEAM